MSVEYRKFLEQRLPAHMVPSVFVEVDRLPKTPNGKTDRSSLPAVPAVEPDGDHGPGRYADPIDTEVAAIWRSVLAVQRIGPDDTFFNLGGHSLLVFQVLRDIRESFGVDVRVRQFFQDPTVGGVANLVRTLLADESRTAEPSFPVRTVLRGETGRVSTSLVQESQLIVCANLPNPCYPMTVLLQFTGAFDVLAFRRALETVAGRHDSLRSSFPSPDDNTAAFVTAPADFAWPLTEADLSGLPAEQHESRLNTLLQSFGKTLDVRNGPAVDALLIRHSPGSWIVGLSIDHLICDRISLGIVLEELAACYNAYIDAGEPTLPATGFSFSDYAQSQRDFLDSPQGRQLTRRWVELYERHGSLMPVLALREEYVKDAHASGLVHSVVRTIPGHFVTQVNRFCQNKDVTPYVVFLTALLLAVRHFSDTDTLGVRMLEAGRQREGTDRLIGWLAQMLPLWVEMEQDISFDQAMARVAEGVRETIESSVPMLHQVRAYSGQSGTRLTTQQEMAEAHRVPHILFLCDMAEMTTGGFRGTTVRPYPLQREEVFDYAPVVTVVVEPWESNWRLSLNYPADGYERAVMRSLLDNMISILSTRIDDEGRRTP